MLEKRRIAVREYNAAVEDWERKLVEFDEYVNMAHAERTRAMFASVDRIRHARAAAPAPKKTILSWLKDLLS